MDNKIISLLLKKERGYVFLPLLVLLLLDRALDAAPSRLPRPSAAARRAELEPRSGCGRAQQILNRPAVRSPSRFVQILDGVTLVVPD